MGNLGKMRCEYISLCKVVVHTDKNGNDELRLRRLADIKGGGFIEFRQQDDKDFTFDNRALLYFKDDHSRKVGDIGIWRWKAYEKSIYEPNKDFIDSQYEDCIKIVKMAWCSRCEDVVKQLQKSNLDEYYGNKTLFTVDYDDEKVTKVAGVLCEPSDLGNINGKVKLIAGALSKFEIACCNVLSFSNNKYEYRFYKYKKLAAPIDTVRIDKISVREPFSVIKEVIQQRIDKIKWLGFSQDEVELIQNFLTKLPDTSFVQEIASSCACDEKTAEKYLREFKQNASSSLSVENLDTDILFRVLKQDLDFVEKCKAALTNDWQKENADKQNEAKSELEKIRIELSVVEQKLSDKNKELSDIEDSILNDVLSQKDALEGELEELKNNKQKLEEEIKEFKSSKQKLEEEIKAKENLAAEVEAKVFKRIEVARKNVADCISEMIFANPQGSSCIGAGLSGYKASYLLTTDKFSCKHCGELTNSESFLDELSYNLRNIGYDSIADEMTEAICFCLASKLPLVCKANVLNIAQCISAMFNNDKVCIADLPIEAFNFNELVDEVNKQTIDDKKLVLVVNGAFDSFNLNTFNRIVSHLKTLGEKIFLIFSLGGVALETIPNYVWDQAMFIDGDVGLGPCSEAKICSYVSNIDFKLNSNSDEIKDKFEQLSSFSGFLSNTAKIHYAQLAADYNLSSVFTQLIIQAKSSGNKEKLLEISSEISDFNELPERQVALAYQFSED